MASDTKNAAAHTREAAIEKLRRLQRSPKYRSFLSQEAIDAFAKVESSAFAGKSLPLNKRSNSPNKGGS